MSYDDISKVLSEVTEKEIAVKHVNDAGYGAFLQQVGIHKPVAETLVATRAAIRDGHLDVEDHTLETLLKQPVTPLNEAFTFLIISFTK